MSIAVRICLTLVVLLLLPTFAAVAGAQDTTLQIDVRPVSGSNQPTLSVTGVGAQADRPVQVQLIAEAGVLTPLTPAVQVDPDGNGEFTVALPVPAGAADEHHTLRAEQRATDGRLLQSARMSLDVGADSISAAGAESAPTTLIWAALLALLLPGVVFQGARLALQRA